MKPSSALPGCSSRSMHAAPTPRYLWLIRGLAFALVVSAFLFLWRTYSATGLFVNIGMDYGLYLAQATVMGGDDPTKIYDKSAINVAYRHLLDSYAHDPSYHPATPGMWASHVPYLPVFAWMMQPMTWLDPPMSVLVWSIANAVVALWIGWRVARHCPGADPPTVMLLFLGSYPVVLNLHVGQIQILLAWVVTECYLALRAGRDVQAGLWLGCLLIKPHYGLLLGLLLLWKGRWKTVFGVAVTGSVLLGASLSAGGLQTLLVYPHAFSDMVQFRGDSPIFMLNWRSLILDWYPAIYWRSGILLTICLGLATIACVAWVWRGPWNAASDTFPAKMLLTLLATIMILYHSHPYGATILVMPLAAMVLSPHTSRFAIGLACAGAILPALVFTHGHGEPLSNWELTFHLELASQMLKAFVMALCAYTFLTLLFLASATTPAEQTRGSDDDRARPLPPRFNTPQDDTLVSHDQRPAANG